ncbi:MAG TPA: carboxypeptidase-like regulatory domain-containing protein, partial [Blastocatellia bacterium]|nr:carboxypeptidase-like regulatory domain-containing protein [Blastocatellia bacterium]
LVRVPTEDEAKDKKKIDSLARDYTTNNHGEFAFRLPSSRARYKLTASLDGYKSEIKTVDVSESEAVPLSFSLEPVKK